LREIEKWRKLGGTTSEGICKKGPHYQGSALKRLRSSLKGTIDHREASIRGEKPHGRLKGRGEKLFQEGNLGGVTYIGRGLVGKGKGLREEEETVRWV